MTDRQRPTHAAPPFNYPGDVDELLRWARATDAAQRAILDAHWAEVAAAQSPPAVSAHPHGPTGSTASEPVDGRPAKLVAD